MGHIRTYTKEERQIIRDNWLKIPASHIGKMIGRTKNSIIGQARDMGLRQRRPDTTQQMTKEAMKTAAVARVPRVRPPPTPRSAPQSRRDWRTSTETGRPDAMVAALLAGACAAERRRASFRGK